MSRGELRFQDPYQVIFLGSSELQDAFSDSLWAGIWDFPNREIFDFAVPRALPEQYVLSNHYIDMDHISSWLRQHQKEVGCSQLDSLRTIAYRCWESLMQRLERRHQAGMGV